MTEQKPKFTLGPWFVIHESYIMSRENGFVARVNNSPLGRVANMANAALIAAAPEMYDILDRVLGRLEFCKLEQSIDIETEREIRQVLAKARGEAK